jgi:UDP-glucose 4-epimerase
VFNGNRNTYHSLYVANNTNKLIIFFMKIIVTGGAGFIGSHIVDAYIARGHSVAVIDNLSTGDRKNLNPKARFYKGDVSDRAFIYRVFKKERPQIVNHQAALASLRLATKEPEMLVDANIAGTMNVLLASGRAKIKRFIFASSCSVLGHPEKLPATESTPIDPLSPYAYSKYANETMIEFYAKWHKFPFVIFRYPNVYGPRQSAKGEAGIIPIFVGLMRKNKRPHIFGDGSKTRDYIYVTDVVSAHMKALTKAGNMILGLGTSKETSDQEIFDQIEKNMGTGIRPVYEPFRTWEAMHVSMNAARAKKVLGWKPHTHVREGVAKTVASYLA